MILTANRVTFARIALVPVIVLLICMHNALGGWLALLTFTLAALSDWLDGYLARKHNDTSLLGRVFDPISDKMLVVGCLLGLAYTGQLAGVLIFPALAILMRETFVAGLREYAAHRLEEKADKDALSPTPLAKAKTALQMVTLGLLIISPYLMTPILTALGGFLLWIAAGISLYTGYEYLRAVQTSLLMARIGEPEGPSTPSP